MYLPIKPCCRLVADGASAGKNGVDAAHACSDGSFRVVNIILANLRLSFSTGGSYRRLFLWEQTVRLVMD
jgi:hypothetical protein